MWYVCDLWVSVCHTEVRNCSPLLSNWQLKCFPLLIYWIFRLLHLYMCCNRQIGAQRGVQCIVLLVSWTFLSLSLFPLKDDDLTFTIHLRCFLVRGALFIFKLVSGNSWKCLWMNECCLFEVEKTFFFKEICSCRLWWRWWCRRRRREGNKSQRASVQSSLRMAGSESDRDE